jgi:hypothetical protein
VEDGISSGQGRSKPVRVGEDVAPDCDDILDPLGAQGTEGVPSEKPAGTRYGNLQLKPLRSLSISGNWRRIRIIPGASRRSVLWDV